jgi:hypothetical protein
MGCETLPIEYYESLAEKGSSSFFLSASPLHKKTPIGDFSSIAILCLRSINNKISIYKALKEFKTAVKYTNTICKNKKKCCKQVTVTITCHFGLDLLGRLSVGAGTCGKTATIDCGR